MKKIGIIFLLLIFLVQLYPVPVYAADTQGCHTLQADRALADSQTYGGTAKAAILYELNTQTMVFAHNPDLSINPTGLIKLLSALIVLEEGNLDDVVTVNRSTLNSVGAGAVSAGLKAGEQLTLRDLLYCVMVSSANDAAAVMAEHVAGSQGAFVDKMNARVATAGCANTFLTNVHGLKDERQYSTARDLAILTELALKNEQFREMFAVTEYIVPATNLSAARHLRTTNYLMDTDSNYFDDRVTGGKPAAATTTDRSVICIAGTADEEYLCVIISAKARTSGSAVTRFTNFDEATKLLSLGFDGFAVQQVVDTQQPFGMYPVSGGENYVVVASDGGLFTLLPVAFDSTKLHFVDRPDGNALRAPLAADTTVGTLEIYYESILIGKAQLVACHDVAAIGTTIRIPGDTDRDQRDLLTRILIWSGIVAVILGLSAAAVLMAMRRSDASSHKSSRDRSANGRERRGV